MPYGLKLKDNEKILDVIHPYGLTFFGSWILSILLIATPFFFMFWLFSHSWWGQALFFVPLTVGFLVLIRAGVLWKKNVAVLTTHRIIDIDRRGFFDKTITRISYDQIEDVHGRIKGFWQTIGRYGSVTIQTNSDKTEIILDKIKHPTDVQHVIEEFQERYLFRYAHEFSGDVAAVITEKLYELGEAELLAVQEAVDKRLRSFDAKKKRTQK